MKLPDFYIDDIIKTALSEDINYIDLASDYLINEEDISSAVFIAKDSGILCGIDIALRVFSFIDKDIITEKYIEDGEKVRPGDIIAAVKGHTRSILKAERTALNLVSHMSGISTAVSQYVKCCEGTNCCVCETRKTLPGLRALQKYAVIKGGGKNHRFNLSDAAMLKDNHIDAYGGITPAVNTLRSKLGHLAKIEVEVRTAEELREALNCGCDVIMLDNMTISQMAECVKIAGGKAVLEASGNIGLHNAAEVAGTGVNMFSVGALTHSVKAFDISLRIKQTERNQI